MTLEAQKTATEPSFTDTSFQRIVLVRLVGGAGDSGRDGRGAGVTSSRAELPGNCAEVLADLKARARTARLKAATSVNRELSIRHPVAFAGNQHLRSTTVVRATRK